jgi:hypothetical protein
MQRRLPPAITLTLPFGIVPPPAAVTTTFATSAPSLAYSTACEGSESVVLVEALAAEIPIVC